MAGPDDRQRSVGIRVRIDFGNGVPAPRWQQAHGHDIADGPASRAVSGRQVVRHPAVLEANWDLGSAIMATIAGSLGNRRARPVDFNLLMKSRSRGVQQDLVVPVDITFVQKVFCGGR